MTEQLAVKAQEPERDSQYELWEKYAQRKAELEQQGLSPYEYFMACQRIADELGI